MDQTTLESAKERVVQLYGIGSCKKLINMPSSETAFSTLRRNIERELKKTGRNIFIFNDTPQLKLAIDDYMSR